jgi:preprotein translocase subunit SecG
MIYGIFIAVHILVAGLLITVVLMQTGRGGGLAGAFGGGGGGGQSLFGGRGATTFLTKTTWVLGTAFMLTSFMLALTVSRQGGSAPEERSIMQDNPIEAPATTLPLEPADAVPSGSEAPPATIPLGDDAPAGAGEAPAVPPPSEGGPSGDEPPAESTGEVPSSGGN